MSYSKQRPPYYNSNSINQQLINTLIGNHDLICGCDDPASHLLYLLATKTKPKGFTDEEKENIKKCLGFTETTTDQQEDIGFDAGDLENLFGSFAEEDTG